MHPATIEFIERCGEILKSFGAAFVRWALRLKTETVADKITDGQQAIVPAKDRSKN